jgi:hypothetical protein
MSDEGQEVLANYPVEVRRGRADAARLVGFIDELRRLGWLPSDACELAKAVYRIEV